MDSREKTGRWLVQTMQHVEVKSVLADTFLSCLQQLGKMTNRPRGLNAN